MKRLRNEQRAQKRGAGRKLSHAHLASLSLGVLLALAAEVFWFPRGHSATRTQPEPASRAHSFFGSSLANSGLLIATNEPWGDLRVTSLALERPDELFPSGDDPVEPPRWHFPGYSADQVGAVFRNAGLSEPEQITLFDPSRCRSNSAGIEIDPPLDLILHLPSHVRQKVYSVLAGYPENFDQRYPFLYRMGRFEEWFSESGLTTDKVELIEKLSYTNANALCFADMELFRSISSSNENYLLIKALSRVSTELVRLNVETEDIPRLLAYWGKRRPAQSVKPLLESVARSKDSRVGIGFFLPAFARLRLYTYPDPMRDPDASHEDCYWSSMNFFNERPDARFFDFAQTTRALQTEYRMVKNEPCQFGDIILLADANGTPEHMCVYVAADIVFTKNGAHYFQPWVIMRLDDMLARYPAAEPGRTKVFRLKSP